MSGEIARATAPDSRAEPDPDAARSTFEAALRISCRNGDNWATACAILGLARLAEDAGDPKRASEPDRLAAAFLNRSSNPWQEFDARYRHSPQQANRTPER